MTPVLSFFDRFAVFICGLLLVVAGLYPLALYFDIPRVSSVVRAWDRSVVADLPQWSWYPWVLGLLCVIFAAVGISMIVANLRKRSFTRRELNDDHQSGNTTVHIGQLAGAMGTILQQTEAVTSVQAAVAMIKDRPTITFTVSADPHADLHDLVHVIEATEDNFRDAVEDLDLDTVYKLHLNRVEA
ncbi:hypothetical protein QP027_01365 [Corynebacterium breve]|uniref:Alkaline shock response membrane anchor protein AmaP n=1 Tax=Corynebacterium breve TaxID=3049799 RepID=A0ABY8VIP0_9CORY|nr:hypothetical protein [Corynebacterium breve]WIM68074.1 hypothetical protein QP027_01365 [Corynebacterium breve]